MQNMFSAFSISESCIWCPSEFSLSIVSRLWSSGIVKYYYWEVALRASRPTTAQRKAEGNWSDFNNQAFLLNFYRGSLCLGFFSPQMLYWTCPNLILTVGQGWLLGCISWAVTQDLCLEGPLAWFNTLLLPSWNELCIFILPWTLQII